MSQYMDRLVTVSEMIAIEQASDRGGQPGGDGRKWLAARPGRVDKGFGEGTIGL